MKADSAIVMSFFKNEVPAGTRINLKWPNKHEVTDFKLDQLGELVRFLCYRRSTTGSRRGLSIFTAPSES